MRRIIGTIIVVCLSLWPDLIFGQGLANNYVPPVTSDGAPNLNYHWIEGGGARLYWNSIYYPRQMRLNGATFRDPADVPFLVMNECDQTKKVKRYYRKRNPCGKTYRSKAKPKTKTKVKTPKVAKRKLPPRRVRSHKLTLPANKPTDQAQPSPVKMQAADPVGHVPPERLQ